MVFDALIGYLYRRYTNSSGRRSLGAIMARKEDDEERGESSKEGREGGDGAEGIDRDLMRSVQSEASYNDEYLGSFGSVCEHHSISVSECIRVYQYSNLRVLA